MSRFLQPEPWRIKVIESIRRIPPEPGRVRGLRIVHQAPVLQHFTARFEEVE